MTATEAAKVSPLCYNLADRYVAFYWHTETFDLPKGAIQTAWSDSCPNQAFIYSDRVVGMQYHLNPPERMVEALFRQADADLHGHTHDQNAAMSRRHMESMDPSSEQLELILHNIDYCFADEYY